MKIINPICPYCNKETININSNDLFKLQYGCKNHNIYVEFGFENRSCTYIELYNETKNIRCNIFVGSIMHLYHRLAGYSCYGFKSLTYDVNLTPENFEKKIKTYLTFQ